MQDLRNPSSVPRFMEPELPGLLDRAYRAGALYPVRFMGVGMYGAVFCDDLDHAWKVGRLGPAGEGGPFMAESLATEYGWFRDAKRTSIAQHVVRAYAFHPEEVVLERECVPGRPGGWSDDSRLHKIHQKIAKAMEEVGWTAPEFKEDSYIIEEGGNEVLVDASMAQRIGLNLAGWVEDVLDGRRQTRDSWHDLGFYLVRELRHGLPREVALPLLERLVAKDPSIRRSFIF